MHVCLPSSQAKPPQQMIPGTRIRRMCHKTKGAAKRGGFQLGTKNILWNTTISNRATHGWADWNISGNKHYGATQIHTETINLNGEEGGSKFDPERNQSRASNKGIRPHSSEPGLPGRKRSLLTGTDGSPSPLERERSSDRLWRIRRRGGGLRRGRTGQKEGSVALG